ncbi:MAG: hypothetical protein H6Q08_1272 [Acidobacteria bacterium]|jgi:hypothetical protein|nr:hypothetical protein [Acidobacteriota bacterium]
MATGAMAHGAGRNTVFALLGGAGLMLKSAYHGPLEYLVHDYGGNVFASLALYFAARPAASRYGRGQWTAAAATLLAVEAFEVTDGFGLMANVYDPLDLLANLAGVAAALAIDTATTGRPRTSAP